MLINGVVAVNGVGCVGKRMQAFRYTARDRLYVQWMRMDQSDENYYKTKRELEKLAQAAGMPGPEAVKAEAGY
jgi:hypothetical protein